MVEIIGGQQLEPIGVVYDEDEVSAITFALRLYASQVRAGNARFEGLDVTSLMEAMTNIEDMIGDFDKGSNVVMPQVSGLIDSIFLPYVVGMHDGLNEDNYYIACRALEVEPVALLGSAVTARQMLSGERLETAFTTWQE